MPRRCRMRVVIIVPAFAKGEKSDPPAIAGIVTGFKAAPSPHVCRRIDQPGGVEPDHYPQTAGPQKERQATDSVENDAQYGKRHPVIVVEPDVKSMFRQIRRVPG